jgi:cell division protease FtsH
MTARSHVVEEADLPLELSPFQAVEAAYPSELLRSFEALRRGLPVMIECDKELTPYFFKSMRDRLKAVNVQCIYLDGRPDPNAPPTAIPMGLIGTMIQQLRDVVRGAVAERIVVLPHLDLLTTSTGGLTAEAREVIPLLYENPKILWIGFKDPSFPLPRVIENLFPHKETIIGIGRERLRHLVTQKEARKFGRGLNPFLLYKYVSGVNAARLRRLLSSITGEDYPTTIEPALAQLRTATLSSDVSLPNLDLRRDIGGYEKVKARLENEILDLLIAKENVEGEERIKQIESLIPRGIIFWGPPGTGKTLFAKAMATSLGAAVIVVSGPELKSRWVGESEERIREIFVRARQSAPSVIIFDELDSFASARGTYTGSGVEHSMVNQLLTEMDGFRKDELVFVVGTTNFAEILDPALLRPGRFEFLLEIPSPDTPDRRAIFSIYDKKFGLDMSERALEYAVKRTGDRVEGTRTRYSGDHLQALCRAIARRRLKRTDRNAPTEVNDVEEALTAYLDRPELTSHEERVVATHEAGHAVCALFSKNAPPIDRISIQGDLGGTLGYVEYGPHAHRYVVTEAQLRDSVCVLFGGREAESLLLDDLSIGSSQDLERATLTARALVEELGLSGSVTLGIRRFQLTGEQAVPVSERTREHIEEQTALILETERKRARTILEENRSLLETLRDLLIDKKVLDRQAFAHLVEGKHG